MFEWRGCYSRLVQSRLYHRPSTALFDTYFILDVLNFVKRHFAKFTCSRVYALEFYERGTQFALRGGEKKEEFREFCAFYDYTLEYTTVAYTCSLTKRASYLSAITSMRKGREEIPLISSFDLFQYRDFYVAKIVWRL